MSDIDYIPIQIVDKMFRNSMSIRDYTTLRKALLDAAPADSAAEERAELIRLSCLKQLCQNCNNVNCPFWSCGECRYSLVHERGPAIKNDGSCIEYANVVLAARS